EEVAARALAAVRADVPRHPFARWIAFAVPAAAAVVIAFLIPFMKGDSNPTRSPHGPAPASPPRKGFAIERTHDHAMHGEFMAWAGARYDELTDDLEPGQILTPVPLRLAEPRARAIAPVDEFTKVVKAKLGREFKLPAAFVEGGRI